MGVECFHLGLLRIMTLWALLCDPKWFSGSWSQTPDKHHGLTTILAKLKLTDIFLDTSQSILAFDYTKYWGWENNCVSDNCSRSRGLLYFLKCVSVENNCRVIVLNQNLLDSLKVRLLSCLAVNTHSCKALNCTHSWLQLPKGCRHGQFIWLKLARWEVWENGVRL